MLLNICELEPPTYLLEKLFEKHSSKPYNPKLANVFFKSGMIEAWGRGFDKIKEACAKYFVAQVLSFFHSLIRS